MHAWNGTLDRPQNVAVVHRGQIAWKTALNADFACAQLPCLARPPRHLFQRMKIRIRFTRPAAERAKLASDKTNVREVNISVDHVRNDVACQLAAKHVACHQQCDQIGTFRASERIAIRCVEASSILPFENAFKRTSNFPGSE